MGDFLYLLIFIACAFVVYALYCLLQIVVLCYKCRNFTKYLRKNGFKTIARARKQIVYTKELSKEELQSRLNRWGIHRYSLLDNTRYYECITVTERKTYARSYLKRGQFYSEDFESGYIIHHYYRLSKFVNGDWLFRKIDYLNNQASKLAEYAPLINLTDTDEHYTIALDYVNKSSLLAIESEIEFWSNDNL